MFFAETLGPSITRHLVHALCEKVQNICGTGAIAEADLRQVVTDFLNTNRVQASPDQIITYLQRAGRLQVDQKTPQAFRLAA